MFLGLARPPHGNARLGLLINNENNKMTKIAVITGATSGIGEAFAHELAANHDELWLCGRNQAKLSEVALSLEKQFGVKTLVKLGDLAKATDIKALANDIKAASVTTLINNAGYSQDGKFHAQSLQKHTAIMRVHMDATVALCHAALPNMIAKGYGQIINVASVASWTASPSSPMYAPTKTFVRSMSETLAASYSSQGVQIQALCPGFTITDFHEKLGLNPAEFYKHHGLMKSWSAQYVAQQSLADLAKGRVVSVPGWNYKLIVMVLRYLPMWALQRIFKDAKARYGQQH